MTNNAEATRIRRSWNSEARTANFANFRFYPILVFGLVCTLGPIAFVLTVLGRMIVGLPTGSPDPIGVFMVFLAMGAIFYFGLKALRLQETGAPFVMAFGFGIIAAAISFGERRGEAWVEKQLIAPTFWVLMVVCVLAGIWLIAPHDQAADA